MTSYALFLIFVGLFLAQFAILSGSIWLGAKIARVAAITVRRSVAIAAVLVALHLVITPIEFWLLTNILPVLRGSMAFLHLLLGIVLLPVLLDAWVIKRAFRTSVK